MNLPIFTSTFGLTSLVRSTTNSSQLEMTGGPTGEANIDLQREKEPIITAGLFGLPVINHVDGAGLGRVHDVLFDLNASLAVALVLDDTNWLDPMGLRIVPWGEITSCGADSILVRGLESKVPLRNDEWSRSAVAACWECCFSSTEVRTQGGQSLGQLCDAFLEEHSGQVVGFKTTVGFQPDSLYHKRFIPRPSTQIWAGCK